jgi:hypothetical protein
MRYLSQFDGESDRKVEKRFSLLCSLFLRANSSGLLERHRHGIVMRLSRVKQQSRKTPLAAL